jgi:hypothetical protein
MDRASKAQAAADLLAAARAATEESCGPGASGSNSGSALVGAIAQAIAISELAKAVRDAGTDNRSALEWIGSVMPQ